jgi:hypothetical protein
MWGRLDSFNQLAKEVPGSTSLNKIIAIMLNCFYREKQNASKTKLGIELFYIIKG